MNQTAMLIAETVSNFEELGEPVQVALTNELVHLGINESPVIEITASPSTGSG